MPHLKFDREMSQAGAGNPVKFALNHRKGRTITLPKTSSQDEDR